MLCQMHENSLKSAIISISAECMFMLIISEAVRRADALLQTNYVTSDVCDHKCAGPTNAWVVRCLS